MTITTEETLSQKYSLNLPPLDVALLSKVVRWAVIDHGLLERASQMSEQEREAYRAISEEEFAGWGTWAQGAWATERYDQGRNGYCGSSFCMAGQTVAQDRNIVVLRDEESCVRIPQVAEGVRLPNFVSSEEARNLGVDPDEDRVSISVMAEQMLGMTDEEGNIFFAGNNQIDRIVGIAMLMAQLRGQELDLPPWVTITRESEHSLLDRIGDLIGQRAYYRACREALGLGVEQSF